MRILEPNPEQPYAIIQSEQESLDDISDNEILATYKQYGAILFRDFHVEMEDFSKLAKRFCISSVFNESPDRHLLDSQNLVQTVNIGTDAFPLHPELSREPFKPDVCFFWCVAPPKSGGETTVCDGAALVKALPRETYEAFSGRRLVYKQVASPEVCEFWLGESAPDDNLLANPPSQCPYRFHRTQGIIVREFSRPAFHKTMFGDELAFGNFLFFARAQGKKGFPCFEDGEFISDPLFNSVKQAADQLTRPILWGKNDIAVLDNTRFMHGRNAITDPHNRLIASYFGYLKDAPANPEEPSDPVWRKAGFRPPQKEAQSL